jgi:hypothetical protein
MTDAERIAGLEGQLKAQAGNAAEEARQNAVEIDHLREAVARMEYYKGRDDEGAVIQKALEARLARARADALEDAARVAEQEVTTYHEGMSAVDVRLSHTRGPKWSDGPSIANAIRALASDTDTGGGDAPYTDTEAATSEGE